MSEEDARRLNIYIVAREQANIFSKFYLNLRIAAFSFAVLTIGTVAAFGWNSVFHKSFDVTTDEEKYLRMGIIVLVFVILFASTWFELALSRRYKIAWEESLRYEKWLEGFGLHSKTQLSRAGLRYPARFSFATLATGLFFIIVIEVPLFFSWLTS